MNIEDPTHKQGFLIYPSISITGDYYFPLEDIEIGESAIRTEDKENFLAFYENNKPAYNNLIKANSMIICINDELNNYTKAMVNHVDLRYKDSSKKVLLTNFNVIKTFIDSNMNFNIYLLEPNEKIFKMLDYVIGLDEQVRRSYFQKLKAHMVDVNWDEKFLELRNTFLKAIGTEEFKRLFKDILGSSIIENGLDILVLQVPQECSFEHAIPININYYESRINKETFNKTITFLSYIEPNDVYLDLIKNYGTNNDLLTKYANGIFIENERSINFGYADFPAEIGYGKFTYFNNITGQLILDESLLPLGLVISKQYTNNNHIFLNSVKTDYNLILPFWNQGIIYLFKRLLKINVDMNIITKSNIFKIKKTDEAVPRFQNIHFKKTKQDKKLQKARGYTEETVTTFLQKKRPHIKKFFPSYPELMKHPKYAAMINQIRYKMKYKSFHYQRFNTYLEEKEKQKHAK
jgi:hypothetical protein